MKRSSFTAPNTIFNNNEQVIQTESNLVSSSDQFDVPQNKDDIVYKKRSSVITRISKDVVETSNYTGYEQFELKFPVSPSN